MDFSRLNIPRTVLGGISSVVLVLSLFLLPWYELGTNPQRETGSPDFNEGAFICGAGEFTCTGWETFPILRWLLIAAAFAPVILGWILIRGHRLSWAPGEMTMVVGFTAFVLVLYNGIIDDPGSGVATAQISLREGYYLALLATAAMAATGFLRSQESGGRQGRKTPGTV